jgi:translation initiation factor IF-2
MKNQLDIIVAAICAVACIAGSITVFAIRRTPPAPQAAPKPNLAAPKLPESKVAMSIGLPGGGAAGAPGAPGGVGGGRRGPLPGFASSGGGGGMMGASAAPGGVGGPAGGPRGR